MNLLDRLAESWCALREKVVPGPHSVQLVSTLSFQPLALDCFGFALSSGHGTRAPISPSSSQDGLILWGLWHLQVKFRICLLAHPISSLCCVASPYEASDADRTTYTPQEHLLVWGKAFQMFMPLKPEGLIMKTSLDLNSYRSG